MHHCPFLEVPPKDTMAPAQGSTPGLWCGNRRTRKRGLGRDSVAEHSPSMAGPGFTASTVELTKGGGGRVETRRNPVFIAVCTVRQRQVNAAVVQLLAQCKQMTRLTSSQGQAPGTCSLIRAEALCGAICSLDTTLVYKKNKKQGKNKAWPITPTVCGDHLSSEPTV